jgi:signal transduction histidine kinase
MDGISAFFVQNIAYVYFFYGLAFFALGLVVLLESSRPTEFRFGLALLPLALFGLIHGGHEWYEMFQIFAAQDGVASSTVNVELIRLILLVISFLCLLAFGVRLLPYGEDNPPARWWLLAAIGGLWLVTLGFTYLIYRPTPVDLLIAGDVLARYILAIPAALLAAWALLRERRDFHARGMSRYGRGLLWAALAFAIYGVVGQLFVRTSLVPPSQVINSTLFINWFGIPVQVLRAVAAVVIVITLGGALRAFEAEGRIRLARANKARLEALDAQSRRAAEVEALNAELQAATRELTALVELSRILTSTVDLGRLQKEALREVVHSMDTVCCSMLFLRNPQGALDPVGVYRRPNAPRPDPPPPLAETARQAFLYETPTAAGLDGDVRLLDENAFTGGRTYRTFGAPLRSQDRVFGALAVGSLRHDEPLGEAELSLLRAFAGQMAASVENAQIYGMLQEREAQLEELVRELVTAQEGERRRIARELHDDTGQKLTALALGLAAVEGRLQAGDAPGAARLVSDLRGVSDGALAELRKIMANLRPSQLDDLGLGPTLRWYTQQIATLHPELAVRLEVERLARRLPPEHETVLFRAAQEALTNVVRHAHATQVTIKLTREPGHVRLEVTDNGIGFDPAKLPSVGAAGWGLVGMRERTAMTGGRFEVISQPGAGATVQVTLPLAPEEKQA